VNCTKKAFGGQTPPGPAGAAIALTRPPNRSYRGKMREGRVRKVLGRGGRGGKKRT